METETETISRWRQEAYQQGYNKALYDMCLTLNRALQMSPKPNDVPVAQDKPEPIVEHTKHNKSKGWYKTCWRKVFGEHLKTRILRMAKSGMEKEQVAQELISEIKNSHGLKIGMSNERMEKLITVSVLSRFADMERVV